MNKVALIIPPSEREEQYGALSRAAPELPFLGIAFIAKYLKLKNVDVDVYDFPVDRRNLARFFKDINKYAVVGMPVFITTIQNVIHFAKIIKEKNQRCLVVVGGPHATLFPADFFVDNIDIIVVGEGEVPFYEIATKITQYNFDFSKIKGIYFKKMDSFHYTGDRNFVTNLDIIDSPLLEKFDLSLYYPSVHIHGKKVIHTLTSRGCPYSCKFCAATKIHKGKIRFRTIDLIINELKRYISMGYDSILFYDDSFTAHRRRIMELCKKIIIQKIKIKWTCFTRTNLLDKELLNYMKEAGCYLITFGCESGNNKTLKLLDKKLTVEKNYEGIQQVHKAGILVSSSFMIGLPGEDRSDIERTIAFAKNSNCTFAYFPIFEPYKGTPIFDICKARGRWIKDGKPNNNDALEYREQIWVPDGFTREAVEKYARRAFKEFYLRHKIIFRIIKNIIHELPLDRKTRFFMTGIDYFLLKRHNNVKKHAGSRY